MEGKNIDLENEGLNAIEKLSVAGKKGTTALKVGDNVLKDMKVTFKKDTFGNDEYVLYSDRQVFFINIGNPNKYGTETRLYKQMAERYEKVRNAIADYTINVTEISVKGEKTRVANITKIKKVGDNNMADVKTEYEGFE